MLILAVFFIETEKQITLKKKSWKNLSKNIFHPKRNEIFLHFSKYLKLDLYFLQNQFYYTSSPINLSAKQVKYCWQE